MKELDEHRSHEFAKLPRDPHRISEDGHHADGHQGGEAHDTVDRAEVYRFDADHHADADQIHDKPEGLQDPVEVFVGAPRQGSGQHIVARQDGDRLRHQQDVLKGRNRI